MSCIKIKCYILSVIDNKKIKIEVNDEESLEKLNKLTNKLKKNKMYKLPIDKECDNRFFININNKTKYQFKNINYNHLSDLYGLEVFITFYPKYYHFKTESEDDETKEKKSFFYIGYYFVGIKITNIKIFNS